MKTRLFVIIFLVLISAGTIILLLRDPWSTLREGFEGILLESPGKVDKIEVISSLDTLRFIKDGDAWQLSGNETLNSIPVESLLYTTSNFRVVSIISVGEIHASKESVNLRFYKGRRLASSFCFQVFRGKNIIFNEGDENAYIVELPGYDNLTVQKVYSAEADHYRDHLLINLLPDEISAVSIQPLYGTGFSVVQDTSANLIVTDADGRKVLVSDRKMRLFLSYFTAIRFEEFLPESRVPAEFDHSAPSSKIMVTDFRGHTHELKIYHWFKAGEDKPDLYNALLIFDQNPQILIVNYTYLDLLIRGLEVYLPGL